jgi:hypothetical protein
MDRRARTFGHLCHVCCGVAISAPPRLEDLAPVTCLDCGAPLGTWGHLKAAVKRALEAEGRLVPSPDPLARPGSRRRSRLKPMLFALTAIVTLGPKPAALAGPAEQRAACRAEARHRIVHPKRVDVDLYGRLLERRKHYVEQCMASRPQPPEETGALDGRLQASNMPGGTPSSRAWLRARSLRMPVL